MVGWRAVVKRFCWFWYRMVLFSYGVLSIRVKGKRAESNEAPLFVVAPHTSIFFDMAPIYMYGGHPVCSAHLLNIPLLGGITRLLDPVYLDRFSRDSRTQAMSIIRERAKNSFTYRWKQVLFFPEGLCSNGDSLSGFKTGAFVAGLAVQPITLKIKRHGNLNLTAWTQTGGQDLTCNLFQFMRPWQEIEVHYMPPIQPTKEEIEDPELYAYNVQQTMAKYRNMPSTDYCVHDAKLCARFVMRNNFDHASSLLGIEPMSFSRNMRPGFVSQHICNSFIDIANYVYKRKEQKKDTERGEGAFVPSVSVGDISRYYGLRNYEYVKEAIRSNRKLSSETPIDQTRILPKNFKTTSELTNRQYCEAMCDLQLAANAYEPDMDFLTNFAKVLEPSVKTLVDEWHSLQSDDYDIFNEEVAKMVDKSVAKILGKTFANFINSKYENCDVLTVERVEHIFNSYCMRKEKMSEADEFDEEDYSWSNDHMAIAEKIKSVVKHVPLYLLLIKDNFEN